MSPILRLKESVYFMKSAAVKNSGKQKIYPWLIFAICYLMVFVALGYGSSTKGTFLTAVTGQLGLKRGLFTIADSMRYIVYAILSFFMGSMIKKIGIRKMVIMGFAFLATSFIINSFANDYWQFYIGGAFLGAGICWTAGSMVANIVNNWFTNGKGSIMGILYSANGLGGFTSEFIITKVIYGVDGDLPDAETRWRLAYRIIAVIFMVVGIIAVLIVRDRPEDIGLLPLGKDKVAKQKRGLDWEGYSMSVIRTKPYFYVSAVCVFLTGLAIQSMNNVAKPFMYDLGFDKNRVIIIFASHSLVIMLSKILIGIGYDTIGMRKSFGICCGAALIALAALYFTSPEREILAWVYSIIASFGIPLETLMIPLLVSYMFGRREYKRIFGYFLAFNQLGYALGVPLANMAYDISGTYKGMVAMLTAVMLTVTVVQQISMAGADRDRIAFLQKTE